MTIWIILGAVGVLLWSLPIIAFVVLCLKAPELPHDPDPHRDEQATSVSLYPTTGRDVHAVVVDLMHTGMSADDAVQRALGDA